MIKSILFISLLVSATFAKSESHQPIQARTIDIAPLGLMKEGKPTGIYYELSSLVLENAGYTPNNIIAPYARIVKALKFGDADLTIMFRYPELDSYVDYIAPLPSKPLVIASTHDQPLGSVTQLSGKKIAYLKGAKYNPLIDHDESIIKHFVPNYIVGLKLLSAGRVDAIIGSLEAIQRGAKELKRSDNITINFSKPLMIGEKTPWIQVSKQAKNYLEPSKLRESFSQLQEQGAYKHLIEKYNHD